MELLERLDQNKETSSFPEFTIDDKNQFVRCEEDESHEALIYCTVCLTNLCKKCAKSTHLSKTLSTHKHVSLSEKPKINPQCQLHPSHVLEFACLEDLCRDNPLMCYICKDYGMHKGHKHVLIESEAETIRKSIMNAVQHVQTFSNEVAEFGRKLAEITEKIEGKDMVFTYRFHFPVKRYLV